MNTLEEPPSHGDLLTRASGRFLHECQELGRDFCLSLSRWSCCLSIQSHFLEGTRVLGGEGVSLHPLATWLWFAVEERGEGREREKKKKTEIVNDCRFLRKIELEAFVVRMKIARFPSAGTMGLRVLRGIENK